MRLQGMTTQNQTAYSHIIGVCKLFSCNPMQHMPFWLLKDA